jgi:hypothetical protein
MNHSHSTLNNQDQQVHHNPSSIVDVAPKPLPSVVVKNKEPRPVV